MIESANKNVTNVPYTDVNNSDVKEKMKLANQLNQQAL